jgi:hypothetical protein
MEQYFDIATRFLTDFQRWNPPQLVVSMVFGFSALSAWIMTRYVAAAPLFAGPISFLVLVFAAMISNFAARGQVMMGTSDVQKVLVFTVLGQAVACVLLLATFRVGSKRFGR